jgi:hypothetical protein
MGADENGNPLLEEPHSVIPLSIEECTMNGRRSRGKQARWDSLLSDPADDETEDMYVCAVSDDECQGSEEGMMLVPTPPGKRGVLVGLLSQGDVCNGPTKFICMDKIRQWALAVAGQRQPIAITVPKTKFSVHVKSVSAPADWLVAIYTGAVVDSDTTGAPHLFSGVCNEQGTEIVDKGHSAMLVEFGVDACLAAPCQPVEVVLSWKAEGCYAAKSQGACTSRNCTWCHSLC